MPKAPDRPEIPVSTSEDTVDSIVEASLRTPSGFPMRRTFLQQRDEEGNPRPGPLASLVGAGDLRALTLYLLLLTKASSEPWDAGLPAAVWARALGIELPLSKSATSTISKTWMRLERLSLVQRKRERRTAVVTLRREDGSGAEYTSPGAEGETYLKVPLAFWWSGPEGGGRWYRELSLPELAVLLIARSHGDLFRLPFEQGPDWYGISADTLSRGVSRLVERGVLSVDKTYKKAPLSPVGYTAESRYTLQAPFGPIGKVSSSASPRHRRLAS